MFRRESTCAKFLVEKQNGATLKKTTGLAGAGMFGHIRWSNFPTHEPEKQLKTRLPAELSVEAFPGTDCALTEKLGACH